MPKLLLILLALPLAMPALAQTPDEDIRCVMAGNVFGATEKDPGRKQLALATALFFAGRVDARLSPAQMKAAVAVQAKALTTANAPGVMTECAKRFQVKERAMQVIGQQVAATQKPTVPPAKPAAPPSAEAAVTRPTRTGARTDVPTGHRRKAFPQDAKPILYRTVVLRRGTVGHIRSPWGSIQ